MEEESGCIVGALRLLGTLLILMGVIWTIISFLTPYKSFIPLLAFGIAGFMFHTLAVVFDMEGYKQRHGNLPPDVRKGYNIALLVLVIILAVLIIIAKFVVKL